MTDGLTSYRGKGSSLVKTQHVVKMGEAKAAEARISEQLQNEVLKIDKNCIRPLQVNL